ncbi:hypothetical protein EHR04_12925 [Leptospira levettii]|uniref:DUF4309 domain-containing protein n=1 Tax=Leptospira levettii TaxID=2023178 RepID=A0A2N0AUV1_9LEPT|nr:hypothetical protein [Leptospira levettii]MCW7465067.1 hypothetical protein [Leptospira levettii]MCW7509807.1 hypothetical protein [Leptospira levettii]MCW7513557.1 hypothetical protein [Leptospira levettii]PJZ87985.1 hypothetical protein CH368_14075 [Leptospira levettii]TGL08938.1 hypothetical protein EHQ39_12045 [Leptospira levettii]
MKSKITAPLLIIIVLFPFTIFGESKLFMMYGIKLGQKRNLVSELYGKPFKSHTFEDGYSYDAYKLDEHILVVESENKRPDLVWAIQIQGNKNPKYYGLNEINLGDPIEKVVSSFGKPDEIRNAFDEETKEELSTIQYYSYDRSRNFSIEVQNQKVSSIKLSFKGSASVSETLDINETFKILKNKNIYNIAQLLDQNFVLKEKDKKEYKISGNPIQIINSKNEISNRIFYLPNSLINLNPNEISENVDLRNNQNYIFGKYLKIKSGEEIFHIFFLKTYEGWTLKEVNIETTLKASE